jgi:UDP-glucose 4-epimerase
MKALVTGGCGFIGSNLVDALLKKGDEVFVIDKLTTGCIENISHNFSNKNFHFILDDIASPTSYTLESLIKECDIVFHLAASVGVKYIVDDPLTCMKNNVSGTENVYTYAYKYWKKVIFASTSEVYGKSSKVPLKEDDDRILGPTTINRWSYSASKVIDEHIAFAYSQKGLPTVVLRFFNAYGPRINEQAYGTVVAAFIKQALKEEPITVHGDGKQSRCFTYIDDTVRGILLTGEKESAVGNVFNLGSDKETTIFQLAKLIKKLTKTTSKIVFIPYTDL